MKTLLLLAGLALGLAACGQNTSSVPSINVTGGWTGTKTAQGTAQPDPGTLALTQATDGSITGSYTYMATGEMYPITGSITSGNITAADAFITIVFQGTFTNTTYTGTFVTTYNSNHAVASSGTFSFIKKQ